MAKFPTMKKSFTNDYATFWIDQGIVFFVYHPGVIIDYRAAQRVLSDRLRLQDEKTYPVLCDTRGVEDTEKAARDFLAKEGSVLTSAVAFLVNPSVSKVITEFYIRTNKPATPVKVFTDKSQAVKFLKNYPKR